MTDAPKVSKLQQVGRLAFREEGEMWCCYWAKPDSMVGATLLGAVQLKAAVQNPAVKAQFMDLMKTLMHSVAGELGLNVADWLVEGAPESERSRKA